MAGRIKEIGAGQRDSSVIPNAPSAGNDDLSVVAHDAAATSESLSVLEETLTVSKRAVEADRVRVSTTTETREGVAAVSLERRTVDVTRVPLDRIVEEAPAVRTEGDVTIVPIVEERLVVVKQLVLVEEVHIRQRIDHDIERVAMPLRRQRVEIEHVDANGRPIA